MAWSNPRTWVTSEVVTAAHMNQEVRDNLDYVLPGGASSSAWSPGLAATTTGATVTVTGRQTRIGPLLFLWANFVIGVSGGSGTYYVTLPTSSTGLAVSASEGSGQPVGVWTLRDNSLPASYTGAVELRTADTVQFNAGPGLVSNVFPMQIQQNDELSLQLVVPVA